jgi:hypothetical protein
MNADWRYTDENLEKRALCLQCCVRNGEQIDSSIYEFCHYFTSNGLFGGVIPTEDNPLEEEMAKHNGDFYALAQEKVKSELQRWKVLKE